MVIPTAECCAVIIATGRQSLRVLAFIWNRRPWIGSKKGLRNFWILRNYRISCIPYISWILWMIFLADGMSRFLLNVADRLGRCQMEGSCGIEQQRVEAL